MVGGCSFLPLCYSHPLCGSCRLNPEETVTLDKGLLTGCLGRGMDTRRKGRRRGREFQVGRVFSLLYAASAAKRPGGKKKQCRGQECSLVGRDLAQNAWSGGSEVQGQSRLPETLFQKSKGRAN